MKKQNTFKIEGNLVLVDVSTTRYPGSIASIDLADISIVIDGNGRWRASKVKESNRTLYAVRVRKKNGKYRSESLHRTILGLTDRKVLADHKDGNGLNNSRVNLRTSTTKENARNTKKPSGMWSSNYKGVRFCRGWTAQISVNTKSIHLGKFNTESEAAHAYDRGAKEHFGEFANLNFPEDVDK